MVKHGVPTLVAGITALAVAVTLSAQTSANAGKSHDSAAHTAKQTRAFLAALERKDAEDIAAMVDQRATLTVALSFSGDQEPAARFVGRDQVLGYVDSVFTNMAIIDFADVRVSVTDRGRTSFAQTNGQFTAADGRPYRNVYVFRADWDNGRIVSIEEYANPITFCAAFGGPDC